MAGHPLLSTTLTPASQVKLVQWLTCLPDMLEVEGP